MQTKTCDAPRGRGFVASIGTSLLCMSLLPLAVFSPPKETMQVAFDLMTDGTRAHGPGLCPPDTTEKGRGESSAETAPDQSDSVQRDSLLVPLLIDGLVVDETMTKWGRDFYELFYAGWSPPEDAVNFMITVREQPLPSFGTGISVTVDNEIIFQTRLQPRYEMIEAAAQQATRIAYRRLLNRRPPPNVY